MMDESRDWPALLKPPQRNNFFFGKMMGVAQFEREQYYGMGQRWLINRLTIGTGVLCGLEVTLTADGKRLRVAPGVAIDPWGREIVVGRLVEFDPFAAGGGCGCGDSAPITEAKDYSLCLTYRECTTNDQAVLYADDCPGQPDCQPDTTVETFGLALTDVVTPSVFDCTKWTAAIPTPESTTEPGADILVEVADVLPPRPALDRDLTRPARPPIGGGTLMDARGNSTAGGTTPPTIDVLRARLAELLGSSCAVPATTCVPLALVTAKKSGDAWILTVADGSRRRVYTQAQLLEMILCLAACCSGGHTTTTETPTTKPFQVTGVELGTARVTGNIIDLNPVTPTTVAGISTYTFARSTDDETEVAGPIIIRVTFNGKLDKATVALPAALTAHSVSLTITDDQTDPATPVEVPVSIQFAMVPDSPIAESSTLMLFLSAGERGTTTNVLRSFATSGGVEQGTYTLTLYGDDRAGSTGVPAQRALKSLASTTPAQDLDGDTNGSAGGTYVFRFALSAA